MTEEIIKATRQIITNDSTVFGKPGWTPKREVYFTVYQKIMAAHPIESVLNIGVGPKLSALKWNVLIKRFYPSVTRFANLEIDKVAFDKARKHGSGLINDVTLGDVKSLLELFGENAFDLIYWNQGPEHIYREEREETFEQLKKVAAKAIFMHCPWGSGYDGDIWHYSKNIQKGEFEAFGFDCEYYGQIHSRDTGIMSYKVL